MLTIIREWKEPRVAGKGNRYLCDARCDCGDISSYESPNIKSGNTTRCKYCANKSRSKSHSKHGALKPENKGTLFRKLYIAWRNMKGRCYNTADSHYQLYGGRGIVVCQRWLDSFDNFSDDMGEPPSHHHSIDRIDANGNYEPGNCRWATLTEQGRNKRINRLIDIDGDRKTASEWSEISGVMEKTILRRVDLGWSERGAVFGRVGKYVVDGVIYNSIPEIAKAFGMSASGVHDRIKRESCPTWRKL